LVHFQNPSWIDNGYRGRELDIGRNYFLSKILWFLPDTLSHLSGFEISKFPLRWSRDERQVKTLSSELQPPLAQDEGEMALASFG